MSEERLNMPIWCKGGMVLLLLLQIGACIAGARPSLTGNIDFRAFYAAGSIVRTGEGSRLYDYAYQQHIQDTIVSFRVAPLPFLYPPFAALWFVPLSLLSYRNAFFVQLAINLALLWGTAATLRATVPSARARSALLLPSLYGCCFCVSIALMQGQVSFLLLFICSCAYCALRRGSDYTAGATLCLLLVKFQLALPILVLFFCWKRWRLIWGFATGSAVLGLISWCVVGTGGLRTYARSVFDVGSLVSSDASAAKARYGMFPRDMPNLHGLTFGLSGGAEWGVALNFMLCALVFYYAWRYGRSSLLVALPAAMLVSYHMQPHDLVLLLLPITVALGPHLNGRCNPEDSKIRLYSAIVLLSFLVLPFAAVLMAYSLNFLVAIAVAGVMLHWMRFPGSTHLLFRAELETGHSQGTRE